VKCPQCGALDDRQSRFCEECGARLELACPSCGEPVGAGKRFCRSCGASLTAEPGRSMAPRPDIPAQRAEQILTSSAALEGERKQVTVLFADMKGSMELLADRDPEEARALLDPVLQLMMDAVHRYGGTVNQVMGDGIMALFGAPVALEDHAVRACYAALRLQQDVARHAEDLRRRQGVAIQIRIGINSGEVVVRSIGSDLRMDYTAVGHTTHLAARMEQIAHAGTSLVSAGTLHLAEGYVRVKPLGLVAVRGLDAPVEVYELTGAAAARSRLQAASPRGLSRFVGRDAEVDLLARALDQARQGRGQVVAVLGDLGVGKSRLFHEFVRSHRLAGWLVLQATSVSYGKATSYLPVVDLLRSYLEIEDGDGAQRIREKVTGKMLTLDEHLRETIAPILSLLDALPPDDPFEALGPSLRHGRILGALKQAVSRESQRQPLCVVFEDLQWLDAESQAALDLLVESLPGSRVLLLVNYRPEYEHRWAAKSYYTSVRIDPLPPAHVEDLLEALLGSAPALTSLKARLAERTEGNPLFIEECVRALAEAGALAGERGAFTLAGDDPGALVVPANVQALLAARIDRLPAEDKRLLQSASVIGHEVPLALLEAIADAPADAVRRGLGRLQAGELLYETRLFPEPEYVFKHGLTHEVAYGTLLQERRRELHRRVGAAIEARYAERLVDHVEALAVHFERGGADDRAARHYLAAADKARSRFAFAAAAQAAAQALVCLERGGAPPRDRIAAHVQEGDAWSLLDNPARANDCYDRALALSGDPAERERIAAKRHRPSLALRAGARIVFYEHGGGDRTLVLTNPFLYGLATVQPVLEELCHEFHVITLDPRGTGSSDPLVRPYSLRQHMEDLRAVIEASGRAPVIGVGLSRGGNALVHLAVAHPALVERLVLVGTSLSWERRQAVEARRLLAESGPEAALRYWFAGVFPESGPESLADQYVRSRRLLPPDTILSFFDRDADYEITSLLPAVRVPTLVVRGTIDAVSDVDDARALVEGIPGACYCPFDGKGHLPIFTATREFADVLRQFVKTGTVQRPGGASMARRTADPTR
jgi:class 3 adenylate cyclase/pimeloyl-ACP methyl ester carboxylesterase